VLAGERRDRHRYGGESEFDRDGDAESLAPVFAETSGDSAGRNAAAEEEGKREQRAGHRETACSGGGEAEEDDVAGHVGDEHVAEPQVGECVEDAGHDRQHDQERW